MSRNTQKYISLFSSSQEQPISENLSLPPLFAKTPDPADKSAVRRRELLDLYRVAMKNGEMRVDVENEKDVGKSRPTASGGALASAKAGGSKTSTIDGKKGKKQEEEAEDDFFQSGSDEE
jgi:hypothetical protein